MSPARKPLESTTVGKGMGGALASGLVVVPTVYLGKGLWWVARKPRVSGCLALTGAFALAPAGVIPGAAVAIGLASAAGLRRATDPRDAVKAVARNTRSRYGTYGHGWHEAMVHCGLGKRYETEMKVPKIVKVTSTPYFDHVTLQLLPGQHVSDVEKAAPAMASSVNVPYCRVHKVHGGKRGKPARVRVDYLRSDALAETVKPLPLPVPEDVDLEAIPVGRTEYGETWFMELLDTHWLIGGATGSGKASVLWSLLRGMAPAVRDGWVELWGIDPKSNMELKWGEPMFTRFLPPTASLEDMAAMLAELVEVVEQRSQVMSGLSRKHEATVDSPLIVMVIDELADLTTSFPNALKNQINGDIAKLLRKGRAVGVCLVMALQDVKKDSIPFRGLVPHAVGLRLKDTWETDAICGPGAYAAGARCSDIPGKPTRLNPVDGRGVAFVTELGESQPLRVRASLVTDADIAAMAKDYPAYDRENAPRPRSLALSAADQAALEQEFAVDNTKEGE